MKKVVLILLAILMVTCLAFGFTACKSECDKGNHTWDDGTVTTPATCTTKGVKTFKCTLCDHGEMTEEIDKLAHTPVDASVAATCTTAGVSNATKCSVCGTAIAAGTTIPALNHSVTTWTPTSDGAKHEGTCTREGCGTKVTAEHTPNQAGTACVDCGKQLGTVTPSHDHDYEGQPWKIDTEAGKHYQECKGSDCNVRNEHNIAMGDWTVVDGKHQQSCTVTGCGVAPTTHDAAFGTTFVTTDDTNHYKQCANCTLTSEVGAHDHTARIIEGNDVEHAVVCSACGKQFDNVDHTRVTVEGKDATCTEAGKQAGSKCSVCDYVIKEGAVISPLKHSYTGAKWVISTTEGMHERTCVRPGCGYVDKASHTWDDEHWTSNTTKHWHDCTACPAIKDEDNHDFGEGNRELICKVDGCTGMNPSLEFNYAVVYMLNGERVSKGYKKLADALKAIGENDAVHSATITVRGDGDDNVLNGLGVVIPENHTIDINLNGATYVVASEPVGSTGTATCGFQILAGSKVTITNGTITSAKGSGVKMLIQNYADLTLDGVTLDGTNLDQASVNYTLSNNCGKVTIKNQSEIIARAENGVAFDVWYNMGNWYPQGVSVTVDGSSTIDGIIEYGSAQAGIDDLTGKATLVLTDGDYTIRFSGNANCDNADIKIGEDKLAHNLSKTLTHELVGDKHKHYATCERCGVKVYNDCDFDSGKVTTPANCSTEEVKTFTCKDCGGTKLVTGDKDSSKHDFNDKIVANVTITKAATCVSTGLMNVKCSRCSEVQTNVEIPATGKHTYTYDNLVYGYIDVTTHAVKCKDCDTLDTAHAANHTYVANHCATCCGTDTTNDITQEQIITLMKALGKNEFLLKTTESSKAGTFTLTGYFGGLRLITDGTPYNNNYLLVDADGKQIIVLYSSTLNPTDTVAKGDKITVTGKIKNYNGNFVEFDGFTISNIEHAQSTITVNIVDKNDETSDKASVTFTPVLTNNKAENMSTVKFSVTYANGYALGSLSVKLSDGSDIEYTWNDTTKQYEFVVKGNTDIKLVVKEDDGKKNYNFDITLETNSNNSLCETGKTIKVGVVGFLFDSNGAQNSVNWQNNHVRFQAGNKLTITVPEDYQLISVKFVHATGDYTKGESFTVDGEENKITMVEGNAVWTNTTNNKNSVEFVNGGSKQSRIASITVTYSITITCKHEDVTTVTGAKEATCEEVGYKSAGAYCNDCEHFFINGMTQLADDQIIPALGHKYVHVEAEDGTCQKEAVLEHYTCSNGCDKYFVGDGDVKTEVDESATKGERGNHSYGAWANVTGTATHSATCTTANCGHVETTNCVAADNATWQRNDTHHWKVCKDCGTGMVDKAEHSGETCACGAIQLSVEVLDDDGEAITNDLVVTKPTHAMVGAEINITISSSSFEISMVFSNNNEFTAQTGSNVYTGIVDESGVISIYVSELELATYAGVTVVGADSGVSATVTLNGTTLNKDDSLLTEGELPENHVLTITVNYSSDDYDLVSVSAIQGVNTLSVTLTGNTATCTYEKLGAVSITVTVRAKASVTVTGNGTATVNGAAPNAQKWSIGQEITIAVSANDGYMLNETQFTVTGATKKEGNTYTVDSNVTVTINTTKLVYVYITKDGDFNAFNVQGVEGSIIGDVTYDADEVTFYVKPNTSFTITATPENNELTAHAQIGDDGLKQAFTDNALTLPVTTEDLMINITAEVVMPNDPIVLTRDNLFAELIDKGTALSYTNTAGTYTVDDQEFTVKDIMGSTAYNNSANDGGKSLYPLQMKSGSGSITTTGKFSKLTIVIMLGENTTLGASQVSFTLNGEAVSVDLEVVKATKVDSGYTLKSSSKFYTINYYTIEIELDSTTSKEYTILAKDAVKYVQSMTWEF